MKSAFVLACFFMTAAIKAQDCKNFYYVQDKKTIEMTIYGRKGDVSGRNVYNISNVKNTGGVITSEVNSEMFDKKGKSIVKSLTSFKCSGGVMMLDLKMMIPAQQQQQFKTEAKADNVYIEYPSNMQPGDNLKDANMTMEMNNNGVQQTLIMNITNRKVEGKEPVTTPAGTWDCFKISSKSKMTMKMGPMGIPMNFESTEWYAPGFGIVKTESKHGSTMITAVK